jgi:hypothetical protein
MAKRVTCYDYQTLCLPEQVTLIGAGAVFTDAPAKALSRLNKPTLRATFKATHSGILINQRVYPGARMKQGLSTWLDHYPKPVLSKHPTAKSPEATVYGRVTDAKYVQTATDKDWLVDWAAPGSRGAQGTGYVEIVASISDQHAIEAFLDKRMLTVSVGFDTDAMFCSICGENAITTAVGCGHTPGGVYEVEDSEKSKPKRKVQAYLIVGNIFYDHLAVVDRPADALASAQTVELQDGQSQITTVDNSQKSLDVRDFRICLIDSSGQQITMQWSPEVTSMGDTASNIQPEVVAVADLASKVGVDAKPPAAADAANKTAGTTQAAPPAKGNDVNGNWTMPDPTDGHTHELATLDDDTNGKTTPSKGAKSAEHTHEIVRGIVKPTTTGKDAEAYVSRHPGTYYYDESKKICLTSVDLTAADSKVKATDAAKAAAEAPKPIAPPVAAAPVAAQTDQKFATVIATLDRELTRANNRTTTLEQTLTERQVEITALKTNVDNLQTEQRKLLIDRVLDLQLALGKPATREAKTPEAVQKLRDELAKRTPESLRDSANDLQLELASMRSTGSAISPATAPLSSPALSGVPMGTGPVSRGKDDITAAKERTLAVLRGGKA